MAKEPVEEHTYSQVEMEAFSESRKAKVGPQKSFRQIIKAAIDLKSSLKCSSKLDTAPWVHRPDTPYSDQELVHLCCLVDRGRSFSVSTTVSRKTSLVTLLVQSYRLNPKLALPYYFGTKKKTIPPIEMEFTVMRAWLKQYLDWFDPDLYQYIQNYTLGLPVFTLPSRMAAHDEVSYEQQGIFRNDRLLVPLPKSHNVVSTEKYFGVRVKDTGRQVDPFCLDSFEKPSKPPKYDQALVASCNPAGFEEIPVARAPSINVPSHRLQIRAIRAQVKGDTVRWVGLQGDRYVSLPSEWVELNFDEGLLDEALKRARDKQHELSFVRLPPGDSRLDDPPLQIRDTKGINYYYQGEKDNCLMGGLANAVFWMVGSDMADLLLREYIPMNVNCWNSFVQHVQACVKGYRVRKIVCQNVLEWNDTFPLVVQIRSRDKSESHAICIYNGCIFDSASRFVLVKNFDSLTWCSGMHGFERHLWLYQLEKKEMTAGGQLKKKRSRHA